MSIRYSRPATTGTTPVSISTIISTTLVDQAGGVNYRHRMPRRQIPVLLDDDAIEAIERLRKMRQRRDRAPAPPSYAAIIRELIAAGLRRIND